MSDLKALMLQSPRLPLAVAESLTSGRLQARIGAIPGASEFFLGGVTAYTLDAKARHLGVDRAEAQAVNGVSSRVAEQMARGACVLFGADIGAVAAAVQLVVDVPFVVLAVGAAFLGRLGRPHPRNLHRHFQRTSSANRY